MAAEGVVVDTDVFVWLTRGGPERLAKYGRHVEGRRLILSFSTVAELWLGAEVKGYGARKRDRLVADIAATAVVQPTEDLTDEWARLQGEGRKLGHALGQPAQAHDAWVASIGRLYDLPILTEDKHFKDFPGLKLPLLD